jgi:murein DD-endopeptidase MepM/ murein hydrolase activator NlpD
LKAGREIQTKEISKSAIQSAARQFNAMQKAGLLALYDFQFQTLGFLSGIKFSASDTLRAGEAILLTHQALLFDELPEQLIVSISARTMAKEEVVSQSQLKVVNHKSKNDYIFPLEGRWLAGAAPSLVSHHRWATIQEFAYDFIQLGNDNFTYQNDGTKLSDYYAYGKPIYAVGEGTVVSVLDSVRESDTQLKRREESEEAYLQRVMENQQQLLISGFKYVMGNHVIVKHPNGEYSFYLHLKRGSVSIKPGEFVKQGQLLAELGSSGNSTEPHLHFHLATGSDISHARSLPIRFSNVKLYPDDNGQITHLHSGQIVYTK